MELELIVPIQWRYYFYRIYVTSHVISPLRSCRNNTAETNDTCTMTSTGPQVEETLWGECAAFVRAANVSKWHHRYTVHTVKTLAGARLIIPGAATWRFPLVKHSLLRSVLITLGLSRRWVFLLSASQLWKTHPHPSVYNRWRPAVCVSSLPDRFRSRSLFICCTFLLIWIIYSSVMKKEFSVLIQMIYRLTSAHETLEALVVAARADQQHIW